MVPLSIQMRNETTQFSTALTTTLYGLLGNYLQPWVSTAYGNGITCEQPANQEDAVYQGAQAWGIQWPGVTKPRAFSGVVYAYMVLHDYYTPKHPQGDPSVLQWAAFKIPGYYLKDQRTVTSITLDGKPAAKIVNGSIPALQTPVGPSPCCIIPLTGKPVH